MSQNMIMAESEALARLCPLTFRTDTGFVSCVGARCMAWRWAEQAPLLRCHVHENPTAKAEWERPNEIGPEWVWEPFDPDGEGEPARWVEPVEHANARRRGYCGLAGKVEWP